MIDTLEDTTRNKSPQIAEGFYSGQCPQGHQIHLPDPECPAQPEILFSIETSHACLG